MVPRPRACGFHDLPDHVYDGVPLIYVVTLVDGAWRSFVCSFTVRHRRCYLVLTITFSPSPSLPHCLPYKTTTIHPRMHPCIHRHCHHCHHRYLRLPQHKTNSYLFSTGPYIDRSEVEKSFYRTPNKSKWVSGDGFKNITSQNVFRGNHLN